MVIFTHTDIYILFIQQSPTLKTAHPFYMSLVRDPYVCCQASVFNDLNLGNDVTLISIFRRPHLISLKIIKNKLRPKKYCKLEWKAFAMLY